jgi:hypothetical protein
VHAETAIASTARMAGASLFRTFGLPSAGISPGTPVLSDIANEKGPELVEVLEAGLQGLGMNIGAPPANSEAAPQLTFLETEARLAPPLQAIARQHDLDDEDLARACALATALLIYKTREVLAPEVGLGLAVYGFVEGTKTMPASPVNRL